MFPIFGAVGVIILLMLGGALLLSLLSRRHEKEKARVAVAERGAVASLLLTNFVPENLQPQVKSYMDGDMELEELKEVMSSVVKPGSGFIKYAHKNKERE